MALNDEFFSAQGLKIFYNGYGNIANAKFCKLTHQATDNVISDVEPLSVVVDEEPITEHLLFDIAALQHILKVFSAILYTILYMLTISSPVHFGMWAKSTSVYCAVTGQGEPCVSTLFQTSSILCLSRRCRKMNFVPVNLARTAIYLTLATWLCVLGIVFTFC